MIGLIVLIISFAFPTQNVFHPTRGPLSALSADCRMMSADCAFCSVGRFPEFEPIPRLVVAPFDPRELMCLMNG